MMLFGLLLLLGGWSAGRAVENPYMHMSVVHPGHNPDAHLAVNVQLRDVYFPVVRWLQAACCAG